MWADVLTKPLQGSKFCLFQAFLMNCPENYTKDPPFVPLQPLSSNVPMKTRPRWTKLKLTKPSPRECVEPQPNGTKVPMRPAEHELLIPVSSKPTRKDISWLDSLFPRHPSSATPSQRHVPLRIQATAE
jgi:hypothetical protein